MPEQSCFGSLCRQEDLTL